jgi:hypothetical protein
MCCPDCLLLSECRTRIEIHAHRMAQTSMPNPHYHLCRAPVTATAACTFDCRRCGRLTREMPRLSSAQHFAYGCCHRCRNYQKCDFVEKHRKVLEPAAAVHAVESAPLEVVKSPLTRPPALLAREPAAPAPPA